VGVALMRLEETVRDLAARLGLEADDLNLDLEPIGRLF
jgi:Gas vesicle protein K